MPRILSDIRYSARSFARTPGLAIALLFTIALGIGSNVVVHGFARGLTRGSRLVATDRVVSLFEGDARREAGTVSYEDYLALKGRVDTFEWIGAARVSQDAITAAGQSAVLSVAAVTPDLAGLLGLPLDEGVVISHRVWQREFRAMASVRGEQLRIGGVDSRVAGVAPDWLEGLYLGRAVDVWMLLREEALAHSSRKLWVLGRLRRDISIDQADAVIRAGRGGSGEIRVLPYTGMTPETAGGLSRVATLLGLGAGGVFFITCADVALFLLGRASARSRETSLRVALGASRGQLARGLLSDSVVISVIGGAAGMLLAAWTSRVVPALLFEEDAERLVFAPDLFSIVAASATCVGITIVCGLLPVFAIPHDRPAAILCRESAGPSKAIRRVSAGLIMAQMASCCTFVISTAFLLAGLRTSLQTNAGRRLGQPILATVEAHPDFGIRYFQHLGHVVHSVPSVSGTAWAWRLPGGQPAWQSFRIESPQAPLREVTMDIAPFTADSLPLFILPPRAGRLFGGGDRTCRVAIVNEEAAEMLFGSDTIGRSVQSAAGAPVEIIGVVAMRRAGNAAGRSRPTIYYYADETGPPPDRVALARFRAPVVSKLETAELDANVVSPSYFAAMGLPVVAGRIFPDDPAPRGCRVAVVNQDAAALYFGGKAVGAAVIDERGRRTDIIGVVHATQLGAFQRRVEPAIYFPMVQDCPRYMTMITGVRETNGSTLVELTRTIESVPGRSPAPIIVRTLEAYLSQTALAPLRIATVIIGACAATSLLLSVLGLYSALSDAARQRRRELAVRIALGARRRHVVGQVLMEGGRLACAGAVAGLVGSLLLLRWLAGIAPSNGLPAAWVWVTAPLVLAAAVVIASALPARRALMVDPVTIMRDDNG